MKIALLGYGKMGRYLHDLARAAGDEVVLTVDAARRPQLTAEDLRVADVIIEFTRPEAAVANIDLALAAGVPIVVGTTGWLHELPAVTARVRAAEGSLFWASNFSLGVNVFFRVAERLAALLGDQPDYAIDITETHHVQKLDAPSGTAITLAERVAAQHPDYDGWSLAAVQSPAPVTRVAPAAAPPENALPVPIKSVREPGVPGTHELVFSSAVDTLRLEHEAHSRAGFAQGALTAARWLVGRSGVFTMQDLLSD